MFHAPHPAPGSPGSPGSPESPESPGSPGSPDSSSLAGAMAAVDAAMQSVGFTVAGGDHSQRKYVGQVAGRVARAELSIFPVGRDIHNKLTLDPRSVGAGAYRLTVEVTTGLAARLAAGKNIPLLVGRGLEKVSAPWPEHPTLPLYAHDVPWARRLDAAPDAAAAMTALLRGAEFVEHRPGRLQFQMHRDSCDGRYAIAPQGDGIPQLVAALDTVAQTLLASPAPTPAVERWTDNRALLVTVISIVTLIVIVAVMALVFSLTSS